MSSRSPVVFLVDVDNTLLDNDRVVAHLQRFVERELGTAAWQRYSSILGELWDELGYRDYLGALQRYRNERPHDTRVYALSSFLIDYPFANRLYPESLDVLERLRSWGPTVLLTDGDVVFQPRKVERSGLADAVDGHVLIYIHKEQELDDVERRHPAERYVLIDDKPKILAAIKAAWGDRVLTIMPQTGHYARDVQALNALPPPDLVIERIGRLLEYDIAELLAIPPRRPGPSGTLGWIESGLGHATRETGRKL